MFQYAGQNPLGLADPDGQHPAAIGLGAVCLTVGLAAAIDAQLDAAAAIEAAREAAAAAESLNDIADQFDALASCETDPEKKAFFEREAERARALAMQALRDAAREQASSSAEGLANTVIEAGSVLCIGAAVAIGSILSGG